MVELVVLEVEQVEEVKLDNQLLVYHTQSQSKTTEDLSVVAVVAVAVELVVATHSLDKVAKVKLQLQYNSVVVEVAVELVNKAVLAVLLGALTVNQEPHLKLVEQVA